MLKLEVTFGVDKVLFVNTKTERAEGYAYFEHLEGKKAVADLRKEVDGRPNVSRAALSVLIEVLSSERLAGYRGQTPLNEGLPKEFKQAMREAESAHIRPLFLDLMPKSMEPADKAKAADKYLTECWAGGVYAVVKSEVSKYFCQVGRLPCVYNADGTPDTGKLLSLDAIRKLIQNAKADAPANENEPAFKSKWVNKIVTLSAEFNARNDEAHPASDEVKAAIRALKDMLTTFEGIDREYADLRTRAGTSVGALAKQAVAEAAKPAKQPSKQHANA